MVVLTSNLEFFGMLTKGEVIFATFSFQSQKYEPHVLHEAKQRFYQTDEHKNATCQWQKLMGYR